MIVAELIETRTAATVSTWNADQTHDGPGGEHQGRARREHTRGG